MNNKLEYNEALLESMAHFTDAVWKIDLDKEEVTILSDKMVPKMEGTTITIFEALQNVIRMNPSEEWGKLFETLEVNNLKNLFVSKRGEGKAYIGGECHVVQYAITPEVIHGAVHTAYVSFHDIQAVIDAEKSGDRKLDIYKQQMEQMLDGAGMGTWQMLWDYGPRKLFIDSNMSKLMGVAEDIDPEDAYIFLSDRIDAAFKATFEEYARKLKLGMQAELEYLYHHPTLGEMMIRCGGRVDATYDGPGTMIRGYHQDVTSFHQAAMEAREAKRIFLSNMSHDVRTPMNAIVGMLDIIRQNMDNKTVIESCLNKIQTSSTGLLEIINEVLEMSKLESGEMVYHYETFDLPQMLVASLSNFEPQLKTKNLTLDASLDRIPRHLMVKGCPLHLKKILYNVFSNAIKYSHDGGNIEIGCVGEEMDEDSILCTFFCEDHGIGISEEFLNRIFDPFTQGQKSARSNYTGTGLGLSIVHRLVEDMHGTIDVTSQIGEGTRFDIKIRFEIDKENKYNPDAKEEQPKEVMAPVAADNATILLVEDNDLNLEIAQFLLEQAGYKVTTARDGQQAVNIFMNEPEGTFDAILMDMMMPIMDGIEATQYIRGLGSDYAKGVPIIAMTANTYISDVEACMNAGMNEHLAKPLDSAKLFESLEKWVNKCKSEGQ